jgi:uncharacterized protein
MKRHRTVLLVVCLCGATFAAGPASSDAFAQEKKEGPAFKNYHPPDQIPLLPQTDIIAEMSQAFVVARKAAAGDPVAQHELGIRYLWGRGVEADTVRAAYWIAKAAEQGMGTARFNLAILTYNGWGISWNPFESYRQFYLSAEQGMPEAEFVVAQFLKENLVVPRNDEEAAKWARKSAADGYAPAKKALPDFERAAHAPDTTATKLTLLPFAEDTLRLNDRTLLTTALAEGGPELRQALGMSKLLEGEAERDSVTDRALHAAADAGSPEALAVLGRYAEKGAQRDPVAAVAFYVRALRLGSPQAGSLLLTLLQEKSAMSALRSRAEHDEPMAQFAWAGLIGLGLESQLYAQQMYITPQQALALLQKSARAGYVPAKIELGLCAFAGRWVEEDHPRAFALWREAAAAGSRDAAVRLAMVTLRETHDSTQIQAAVDTVALSADAGSVLAEMALGYCYETGVGVQVRPAIAARYYRSAAVRGSADGMRALRRMVDALRPSGKEWQIEDTGS